MKYPEEGLEMIECNSCGESWMDGMEEGSEIEGQFYYDECIETGEDE